MATANEPELPASRRILGPLDEMRVNWWRDRLQSRNQKRRFRACRRLGELGGEAGVRALLEATDHPDPATAQAAVAALTALDESRLAEALRGALNGDPEGRTALRDLTQNGDTRGLDMLLTRLEDKSEAQRRRVIEALVAIGPAAVKPLLVRFATAAPLVRTAAQQALEALGASRLVHALTDILEGREEGVDALEALPAAERTKLAVPLVAALTHPAARRRAAACEALGRMEAQLAFRPLLARVKDRSPLVQESACRALGRLGNSDAVPTLMHALYWRRKKVRLAACEAIGRLGGSHVWTPLVNLLTAWDADIRNTAAEALVAIGEPTVDALGYLLGAPDEYNTLRSRIAVCQVLGRIGGHRAQEKLLRTVLSIRPRIRDAALEGLRVCGCESFASALEKVFSRQPEGAHELALAFKQANLEMLGVVASLAMGDQRRARREARAALAEAGPWLTDRLLRAAETAGYGTRERIRWVLRAVAKAMESTSTHLLCRACLTRFAPTVRKLGAVNTKLIACRSCGNTADALDHVAKVVCVLDHNAPRVHTDHGVVTGNWLKQKNPFDFDTIEIRTATDEEVERFCLQVGNDLDDHRRKQYATMTCTVAPGCRLSENTLRILRSLFGEVRQNENVPQVS